MVHHKRPHRRLRQQQNAKQMAKMTDLPDELLLQVVEDLAPDDILKPRLTCKKVAPAANTAIQKRMKCLYIHLSTNSLRTFRDFCHHPLWASATTKVVFLGDNDLSPIPQTISSWSTPKEWQKWSQMFAPWPAAFPPAKSRSRIVGVQDNEFAITATLDALISSLTKLPALESIAFQSTIGEPGFNQVTDAMIRSHGRKYHEEYKRRKAVHPEEQRVTDYAILKAMLTSHHLRLKELQILTALPFAHNSLGLEKLTRLSLAAEHGSIFGTYDTQHEGPQKRASPEASRWLRRCAELLERAPCLERLSISLQGTTGSKYALQDYTLSTLRVLNCTFPQLRQFELAREQDSWWQPNVQRPMLEAVQEDAWKHFLQRHTALSLREIAVDNVLITSTVGSSPIEHIKDVVELRQSGLKTSYIVNRFQHHRNCKIHQKQPMNLSLCKAGCGAYSLDATGVGMGTPDIELFAAERGVKLIDGLAWDFGNRAVDRVG
ncbi:hypothetical protein CLAFUW4_11123 [Fulvia fulva]|uniref:F-box domain-containing protein n=1 Tax=Passalora fulva TaxID=5499 RepID=A0A9Q8PCM7_PASFU|nr:uncharacterized protein CLAFUR5_10165 [Fulvia fulva]KAK4619638.1 hypothetical protein CLAFUR4_11128 [Fulvia fulva]KAK4620929.1 hypothetical protein CLAFUR0_11134 [Fulvia fulva]UJO19995.1 hypothetical protein CLAFUR5_10165 [Fulvia fulva]WPV17251.1 hypothetical protein CLAFUW4_11123 [Fulvia fulva]WPV31831.1 hypothetical protein CLAFUW7_11119 [Fulvia fulva]